MASREYPVFEGYAKIRRIPIGKIQILSFYVRAASFYVTHQHNYCYHIKFNKFEVISRTLWFAYHIIKNSCYLVVSVR